MNTSQYRISKDRLLKTLENWDSLMNFKVNIIACGGTALTLMDIKESTKDVDFIVPIISECERLIKFLRNIGYVDGAGGLVHENDPFFIYQFWSGANVFTTELLNSPLNEGQNIPIRKWKKIYLGALNLNDLITTKIFRGTGVDIQDCLEVLKKKDVDPWRLYKHYKETADYDINPDKVMINFINFIERLYSEGLATDEFLKEVMSCR
ncbi:Uncharacterized protein dnl_62780 [Desulfonema limicola]|uniref:DUF6036 domain-containing protein n=1 Tax=Desulfonema limicola TaxID=45656 RepID=A0A975BE53_9BACT|nr:DUF6036 family nucleotidyltransferase [Desulfonema limicola]QTA83857.1 Uncharacterized protein dnl_62780 [Desulfonema limicola]